jgi:minor histocompatibility antigen H13
MEGSASDEGAAAPPETLRKEDALQFPLLGSASLFTLYMAFKFFDKNTVNMIISVYFGLVGCAALTVTFSPLLGAMLPKYFTDKKIVKEIKISHPLPIFLGGESPWDFNIDATYADILSFIGSIAFSAVYLKTKHWALNNVLGISFCLQGIERFSLGTYKIGAILLVGLFFYDIL